MTEVSVSDEDDCFCIFLICVEILNDLKDLKTNSEGALFLHKPTGTHHNNKKLQGLSSRRCFHFFLSLPGVCQFVKKMTSCRVQSSFVANNQFNLAGFLIGNSEFVDNQSNF